MEMKQTGQTVLSVVDCGGKRSATPLSPARKAHELSEAPVRAKAPSPLRSAGAVQKRNGIRDLCQRHLWL